MKITNLFFFALIAACVSSCGKSKNSGSNGAKARVSFVNSSNALLAVSDLEDFNPLATSDKPSEFKMKLIAVYLTEDVNPSDGSNLGQTTMIYLNPTCEVDLKHCDISEGSYNGEDFTEIVEDYFDFGGDTATVNANINAQERDIQAGTYRYARLEFCKVNEGANGTSTDNIQWAYSTGSVTTQGYTHSLCTINSEEFAEPIVITEGDSVTVTLDYDLSSSIQVGTDATGHNCTGSGASKTCFSLPDFSPSAE